MQLRSVILKQQLVHILETAIIKYFIYLILNISYNLHIRSRQKRFRLILGLIERVFLVTI